MVTKLRAAQMMTEAGADMVIANGADPEVLYAILEGAQVGTRFLGKR
jgi:glutamate 5-kinase